LGGKREKRKNDFGREKLRAGPEDGLSDCRGRRREGSDWGIVRMLQSHLEEEGRKTTKCATTGALGEGKTVRL